MENLPNYSEDFFNAEQYISQESYNECFNSKENQNFFNDSYNYCFDNQDNQQFEINSNIPERFDSGQYQSSSEQEMFGQFNQFGVNEDEQIDQYLNFDNQNVVTLTPSSSSDASTQDSLHSTTNTSQVEKKIYKTDESRNMINIFIYQTIKCLQRKGYQIPKGKKSLNYMKQLLIFNFNFNKEELHQFIERDLIKHFMEYSVDLQKNKKIKENLKILPQYLHCYFNFLYCILQHFTENNPELKKAYSLKFFIQSTQGSYEQIYS